MMAAKNEYDVWRFTKARVAQYDAECRERELYKTRCPTPNFQESDEEAKVDVDPPLSCRGECDSPLNPYDYHE